MDQMKKKIQSYLIFVTGPCRFIIFILVPLMTAGLQIYMKPGNPVVAEVIYAMILLIAEIMLDGWIFGGIAMKGAGQLAYINSSKRGLDVMRSALTVSLVRQLVESAVILTVCGVVFYFQYGSRILSGEYVCIYVNIFLLTYVLIVLTLSVTRFFDGIGVCMMAAWIASALLSLGLYIVDSYIALPVLFVIAAVGSAVHVKIMMRRVKEGYCDKTD